jgi:hypothetical protein
MIRPATQFPQLVIWLAQPAPHFHITLPDNTAKSQDQSATCCLTPGTPQDIYVARRSSKEAKADGPSQSTTPNLMINKDNTVAGRRRAFGPWIDVIIYWHWRRTLSNEEMMTSLLHKTEGSRSRTTQTSCTAAACLTVAIMRIPLCSGIMRRLAA